MFVPHCYSFIVIILCPSHHIILCPITSHHITLAMTGYVHFVCKSNGCKKPVPKCIVIFGWSRLVKERFCNYNYYWLVNCISFSYFWFNAISMSKPSLTYFLSLYMWTPVGTLSFLKLLHVALFYFTFNIFSQNHFSLISKLLQLSFLPCLGTSLHTCALTWKCPVLNMRPLILISMEINIICIYN